MLFTTNRNVTVRSTCGRSVEFKKDVPTHVPPAMYGEVQAIGAVPETAIAVPDSQSPVEVTCPVRRRELVEGAYDVLVEANERDNFTAAGSPTLDAIRGLCDLKLTAPERDSSWDLYRQNKATEKAAADKEAAEKENT